jgi:DNA-directed RNA polymerase specialized sigma24 family protein
VDAAASLGLYRDMRFIPPAAGASMAEPDDDGFSDFFRREFERTVRTAYLVLHDQQSAEDVAQDAFGQLYRNWTKVRNYDNPQAWLRRIAIRMAVRVARREESRRALTSGQSPHSLPPT